MSESRYSALKLTIFQCTCELGTCGFERRISSANTLLDEALLQLDHGYCLFPHIGQSLLRFVRPLDEGRQGVGLTRSSAGPDTRRVKVFFHTSTINRSLLIKRADTRTLLPFDQRFPTQEALRRLDDGYHFFPGGAQFFPSFVLHQLERRQGLVNHEAFGLLDSCRKASELRARCN